MILEDYAALVSAAAALIPNDRASLRTRQAASAFLEREFERASFDDQPEEDAEDAEDAASL